MNKCVEYCPASDSWSSVMQRCGLGYRVVSARAHVNHEIFVLSTGEVLGVVDVVRGFEWLRKTGRARPRQP